MGKRTKRWGFGRRRVSGACCSLSSAIFWADALCQDGGGGLVFLAAWVVFAQNLSQLSPLSRMKLVISLKAWYVTACADGVRRVRQ
jgi:hypothetical protein